MRRALLLSLLSLSASGPESPPCYPGVGDTAESVRACMGEPCEVRTNPDVPDVEE